MKTGDSGALSQDPNSDSRDARFLGRLKRTVLRFLRSDMSIGPISVFLIAFASILLILGILLLASLFRGNSEALYLVVQVIPHLVSVAVAALIAMFLMHQRDVLVTVFGLIIIGTLIIPPAQLLGITAYLFNFQSTNTASPWDMESDRWENSAALLTDEVEEKLTALLEKKFDPDGDTQFDVGSHSLNSFTAIIRQGLREHSLDSTIIRLRSASLFQILEIAGSESPISLIGRYSMHRDFSSSMDILRRQQLVNYPFDDYASLTISPEGCELLKRSLVMNALDIDDNVATVRAVNAFPNCSHHLGVVNSPRPDTASMEVNIDKCLSIHRPDVDYSFSADDQLTLMLTVPREGTCIPIKIENSGQESLVIEVSSTDYDPFIELYDNSNRELIGRDDDSGGNFYDARLIEEIGEPEYVLFVDVYGDEPAVVQLEIQPLPEQLYPVVGAIMSLDRSDCPQELESPSEIGIEYEAYIMKYTFVCRRVRLSEGTTYVFRANSFGIGDPLMKLFAPDVQNPVIDEDDTGSLGFDAQARYEATTSEDYLLIVANYRDSNVLVTVEVEPRP